MPGRHRRPGCYRRAAERGAGAGPGGGRHRGGSAWKIAVTGKGGVGKTTLTGLLAYAFAEEGFHVLAIDADPSPCLGQALGFPTDVLERLGATARRGKLI